MIEFQADCGHTIQAPDQAAGKIVKCAYCGREVEAPQREDQDPDILFQEVNLQELADGEKTMAGAAGIRMIQGRQKKAKSAPAKEEILQTGNRILRISLMAVFGVICVGVLALVTKSVLNLTRGPAGVARQESQIATGTQPVPDSPRNNLRETSPLDQTTSTAAGAPAPKRVTSTPGGRINHSFAPGSQGIFVEAFNKAARVYVRARTSPDDSTFGADDSDFLGTGTTKIPLSPGRYRVAVTLDISDPLLAELPGYDDVRAGLEFGNDVLAAEQFFARDTSTELVLIDEIEVQDRLARYYDVDVEPGVWALVSSLYLPGGDSIGAVLAHLPTMALYHFDQEAIRQEMSASGVPAGEFSFVLDMLTRAGQVAYPVSDTNYRVFEIDVRDGSFRTRQLTVEPALASAPIEPPTQVTQRSRSSSPWSRKGRSASKQKAADVVQQEDLRAVLAELRQNLDSSPTVNPEQWRPYLFDGPKHEIWKQAQVRTRTALVGLLEKDPATALLEPIGGTMLQDPDLDVRLALLDTLVLTGLAEAVPFINQRLEDIDADESVDPGQADREEKALLQAKAQLTKGRGSKRKNPWDR